MTEQTSQESNNATTNHDARQQAETELQNAIQNIRSDKEPAPQDKTPIQQEVLPAKEVSNEDEGDPEKEIVPIEDPALQKRFNYVYKQMKRSDVTNDMLRKELKQLNSENEKLYNQMQEVYSWALTQDGKQMQQADNQIVSNIKHQIKEAYAIGNDDLAIDLQERLADVKAEQKIKQVELARQHEVRKQEQQAPQKPQAPSAFDSQEDATFVNNAVHELDQTGNFIRPWLQPNHPQYDIAVAEAAAISSRLSKTGSPNIKDVMTELDKRMRPASAAKPQAGYPSVLSSSMPNMPASQTIGLDDDERYIARKFGMEEKEYKSMKTRMAKTTRFSASDFAKGAK